MPLKYIYIYIYIYNNKGILGSVVPGEQEASYTRSTNI